MIKIVTVTQTHTKIEKERENWDKWIGRVAWYEMPNIRARSNVDGIWLMFELRVRKRKKRNIERNQNLIAHARRVNRGQIIYYILDLWVWHFMFHSLIIHTHTHTNALEITRSFSLLLFLSRNQHLISHVYTVNLFWWREKKKKIIHTNCWNMLWFKEKQNNFFLSFREKKLRWWNNVMLVRARVHTHTLYMDALMGKPNNCLLWITHTGTQSRSDLCKNVFVYYLERSC